jgi:hypothetical protein
MLANTLTLTVAGATGSPFTLTRVNQDNFGSEYKYLDAVQSINLKIRQSTDNANSPVPFYRHNATIEHVIFATTLVPELTATATITLRDGKRYSPSSLLALWQGFNTLFLTLDDAVVIGDN